MYLFASLQYNYGESHFQDEVNGFDLVLWSMTCVSLHLLFLFSLHVDVFFVCV